MYEDWNDIIIDHVGIVPKPRVLSSFVRFCYNQLRRLLTPRRGYVCQRKPSVRIPPLCPGVPSADLMRQKVEVKQ